MVSDLQIVLWREKQAPWGDYGRLLRNGMSAHLPRQEGMIQLERTGPFIPPISFAGVGDIIVTDEIRVRLEAAKDPGQNYLAEWPVPVIFSCRESRRAVGNYPRGKVRGCRAVAQ